jgi:OOP family OmpA-OmpF porin
MKTWKALFALLLVFFFAGCATICCEKLDADGDGVVDSFDKCEDTPAGVEVYFNGCPVDTDGDGVPDYMDECPDTPMEIKEVDAKGCPADSDGDGVLDKVDECPGTPGGVRVDTRGCPVDTDGDGVPDYRDRCPNTPRGIRVDESGCPLLADQLGMVRRIHFDFDKSTIGEDAEDMLDEVAKALKGNPRARVTIEGHTDSRGLERYNLGLSLERAEAVRDYLVAQGVARENVEVVGEGERSPMASNETDEGRGENRRAEFVIIVK